MAITATDVLRATARLVRASEAYNELLSEFTLVSLKRDGKSVEEMRKRLHDQLDELLDALACAHAVNIEAGRGNAR